MSSTNKTTYYELSQYIGTDKPTYLGDYNSDMLSIDTAIHNASEDASTALTKANSAASSSTTATQTATQALNTAQTASETATTAKTTAETASANANAALDRAAAAETAAASNPVTNLAPAYDATLTYEVGDLVTYEGKLYKCIVAVTSAMSFNVNYWDDVTTSEVYKKDEIIMSSTTTLGGTTTWKEALDALSISFAINEKYSIKQVYADNTIRYFLMQGQYSTGSPSFTRIDDEITHTLTFCLTVADNSVASRCTVTDLNTTGITITDALNLNVSSQNCTFYLIKE